MLPKVGQAGFLSRSRVRSRRLVSLDLSSFRRPSLLSPFGGRLIACGSLGRFSDGKGKCGFIAWMLSNLSKDPRHLYGRCSVDSIDIAHWQCL